MSQPSSPRGQVLSVKNLTKNFGSIVAVDHLSFDVQPGQVTGFLGPNGAGKTTVLRMLLGLVRPTSGTALIGGQHYRDLPYPQREVGASLEGSDAYPGRTARQHLRLLASTAEVGLDRVDEVLEMVGLSHAARRRVSGYSLGMQQRLRLAGALLTNPGVLLLDEPANGMDPEGIIWMRTLLRQLADEGRTILVSSHFLTEVQQTADQVIVIAKGRLIRHTSLADLSSGSAKVRVVSPQLSTLQTALTQANLDYTVTEDALLVSNATPAHVGRIAHEATIELHELHKQTDDLEKTFLELIHDASQHPPGTNPATTSSPATTGPTAEEVTP